MNRIGPRMRQVAAYVAAHPGCVVFDAALAVAPHGAWHFGYRSVYRAVRAGIVDMKPNPKRKGSGVLYPMPKDQS
jgi:hypothetical protein